MLISKLTEQQLTKIHWRKPYWSRPWERPHLSLRSRSTENLVAILTVQYDAYETSSCLGVITSVVDRDELIAGLGHRLEIRLENRSAIGEFSTERVWCPWRCGTC